MGHVPSALPEGEPAPPSGRLPLGALAQLPHQPFGVYVHVPFCTSRCGYCDFTTYTSAELGVGGWSPPGPDGFVDSLVAELDVAQRVLRDPPAVSTVYIGGGTPTLLRPASLLRLLREIDRRWGLVSDAEVTVEANPDTVTTDTMRALAKGGVTRVSLGMQSGVGSVLATLERTHRPDAVPAAVAAARAAGLQVSLDLIYGTPGESVAQWEASVTAAAGLEPDHVSAYALVVEPGTRLAARVARGEMAGTDDDDQAVKYEVADELLTRAGYRWYEVSNWSRSTQTRCRHNIGYWTDGAWWGVGPGAHSHVGGVRWWNVRHPRDYALRVGSGQSPAAGREHLTPEQRRDERVLLGVRLGDGLPLRELDEAGRRAATRLAADGLLEPVALEVGHAAQLTRRGRLLADEVVRQLLGC